MPEVKLSNPDKVLFPDDGITKAELAEHYARVAGVMVARTRDRPMYLWRWTTGIAHDRVVQQALPKGAPSRTSLPLTICSLPSRPASTSAAPGCSLPSTTARMTWTAA
jgi:DNA primase